MTQECLPDFTGIIISSGQIHLLINGLCSSAAQMAALPNVKRSVCLAALCKSFRELRMGIIIIPLMFLIFCAWLFITLFIAFLIQKLVRDRIPHGRKISFLSYPICLFLCWLIPNLPGLFDQLRIGSVAKQCGWSFDKQVHDVSGIFIEAKNTRPSISAFSEIYGTVELTEGNRIAHWENNVVKYLPKRTFRYGIRESVSSAADNIYREEILFLDFDTQEVLGKRIEFNFEKKRWYDSSSLFKIALYGLMYKPKPCGFTNPARTDIRTEAVKILVPKKDIEAEEKIIEAEINASVLVPQVLHFSGSPRTISPNEFQVAKGTWTGSGYLSSSCKGIVESIGSLRQYQDDGSWHANGCTLMLVNGIRVPLKNPGTKLAQALVSMDTVTCSENYILAIKRHGKEQLIVHLFSRAGMLIDALRVNLSDISQYFPEGKWPMVWEVQATGKILNITLGNYSYTRTADQGGVLEQNVTYTVQLPM